jgi:2-succinyl-6-hydroxy-2,4-cyclohexadiene-1-carboxylate synthase
VQQTIESFKVKPFLIGYSLGGRIALYLSQKTDLSLKGTIILSSHIGLSCPMQKEARLEEDLLWSKKLRTLSPEVFLQDWYKQKTFASLQKKPHLLQKLLTERHFSNPLELACMLEEMSLAKQPLLNTFFSPTYFLYGEKDIKIKDLYSALPCPKIEIPKAGHIVHLENPKACIKAIKLRIAI